MSEATKTCPACAESIKAEAILCRYCKYDFRGEAAPAAPPPPAPKRGLPVLNIVLVCFLGAVSIVGVIAAIAIPGLLAASRAPAQRIVISSLRTIATAEFDFRSNDRDGNGINDFWTGDLSRLYYMEAGGSPIMLIDLSLADADATPMGATSPRPRVGYWFVAMKVDEEGKPYNGGSARNLERYGFCAYPRSYSSSTRQTFILNQNGSVWRKDTGGAPVLRWPRDPRAEGWDPLD